MGEWFQVVKEMAQADRHRIVVDLAQSTDERVGDQRKIASHGTHETDHQLRTAVGCHGRIVASLSQCSTIGRITLLFERIRRFQSDRKSTRLNSSHGYISYAVFCLK